jgi:hypothetical protein
MVKVFPAIVCSLWVALIGVGATQMWRYENTPGSEGVKLSEWPRTSHLARTPGMPTLVMTAHPMCPCTRASIAELAALMEENQGRLTAHVIFFQPENATGTWHETASWKAAAAIPRVQVSSDRAGAEAELFGGATSGDVLLYDAAGRLVFHGGITAARGQAGPNAGRTALADLLAGNKFASSHTPVFGCPLEAPRPNIASNP